MSRSRHRTGAMAIGLAVVFTAVGCGQPDVSEPAVQHSTFAYTCCNNEDITQVRHPGEIVLVHWIVSDGHPTDAPDAVPLTLTASLAGPYGTVTGVKTANVDVLADPVTAAAPVAITDQTGGVPISRLVIPADFPSGFYNLTTSVRSGGGTQSGSSVIQVAAE